MNAGLFGNRLFVDVIEMRSYWISVGTNSMSGVLIKAKFGHKYTEGRGKQRLEIIVMWPQAKKHQPLLATTRS